MVSILSMEIMPFTKHLTVLQLYMTDDVHVMQSSAKENYLLTDGDLKKLGSITRNNPRKKDWSAMRLYLQSQVILRICSGPRLCS